MATTYKLEVWGASSGKFLLNNHIINNDYGRGGYSYGKYTMNKNFSIYISVGGKGEDGKYQSRAKGGWNGGGDGDWDHSDDEGMAGGGGCTSIQTTLKSDGELKNYKSVKNTDVLIVAGGGGGEDANFEGSDFSYGGGETGCRPYVVVGGSSTNIYDQQLRQATQTSGYAFGYGQSAPEKYESNWTNSELPGAGGGWYGGYIIIPTVSQTYSAAGGGSGYIGGVTNGSTIAGNQTIPSPTGGTETGHTGNGYCKITWMPVL